MTYFAPGDVARDPGAIEGPRLLNYTQEGIEITSDLYGETVIDGIYTGQNTFLQVIFKEWIYESIHRILFPFGNTGALGNELSNEGSLGGIGEAYCDNAAIITLTAQTGTPAATIGPETIIARRAILAPGTNPQIPLGNVERDIPVTFRLLPYLDIGSPAKYRTFEVTYPQG
jgi:hypothetical protein